jgi:hypothetical protein
MTHRLPSFLAVTVLVAACGGGPPSPPALEYGTEMSTSVVYDYEDNTVVSLSLMGQSLEMSQEGAAEYAVTFDPDPDGVVVTLTVENLDATINMPMGAPLRVDEDDVDGPLVFTLDRQGNPTLSDSPRVTAEASQMVSGLDLAHTLFPGLPGRGVAIGDVWVDTVAYEGAEGPGGSAANGVFRYTAVGDTVVSGRSLLLISVGGNSTTSADFELGGMALSQSSEVEIDGHVLWDTQAGLMFEHVTTASGSGTVEVSVAPAALPISVESVRKVRLQGS